MAVLLWPLGVGAIAAVGALLARGGAPATGPRAPRPAPDSIRVGAPGVVRPARPAVLLARFLAFVLCGSVVIYGVMVLAGLIAVRTGLALDLRIFAWTTAHRVHFWRQVMELATQVGNTHPAMAAAGTAAVCLTVTWREDRWLPPMALGTLAVVAYFLTRAIVHTVHEAPPPGSRGTFPSGGSAAAIAVYGLIAYLLWREFSGRRSTAIWAATAVAALGFSEGYSRGYLTMHWFTDILGGLLYGGLLLGLFIAATRFVVGPARGMADRVAAREQLLEPPVQKVNA